MESPECSICIEDIEEGHAFLITPCAHTFHTTCFMRYAMSLEQSVDVVCPFCREKICDGRQISLHDEEAEQLQRRHDLVHQRLVYRGILILAAVVTVLILIFIVYSLMYAGVLRVATADTNTYHR